jgi:hypothetical protein
MWTREDSNVAFRSLKHCGFSTSAPGIRQPANHVFPTPFPVRLLLIYPGGPEGIRTPRLLGANEALYQMSYGPKYTVYLLSNIK